MDTLMLYKNLTCNNYSEINQQILDFVKEQDIINQSLRFWNDVAVTLMFEKCPLFFRWAGSHGLKISAIGITVLKRMDQLPRPHIDTAPARYKLSWPVLNTNNTFNAWFDAKSGAKTEINDLNGKAFVDRNELVEITRRMVDQPGIIDAGVPHDIGFIGDPIFPRVGLQCKLFNEPLTL